tara:strand:- start:1876 stop:2046 length:171 start_codon:yes stop_codon:yes gene_type:complete
MESRIEAIRDLITRKEKELDDIEWADPQDPRIEGLVRELNDYKKREGDGELYEPNF